MLAIGRCLMSSPRLIMFDEPSLGLAPVMVESIFAAILELKNAGVTILLIEQNVAESLDARGICHGAGEWRGRFVGRVCRRRRR